MGRLIIKLGIALLACGWQGFALADHDHDNALSLKQAGEILPLESILNHAQQEIDGSIIEVELEKKSEKLYYELYLLDKEGIVWELKYDAASGQLIEKEQD